MVFRTLGKTGMRVSAIGFGGIPIQRISEEEAAAVINKALSMGVNFIDTARAYTVSEQFIGNAIKGKRQNLFLATKSPALTYQAMKEDIRISLNNLQTDYIDLYQVHNIKDIDTAKKIFGTGGAAEALRAAKIEGIIRHYGVTSHSADVLDFIVENYPEIETIMYPYNIVELQGTELFKKCKERAIGVIAMKPLAGGNIDNAGLAMKFVVQNLDISIAIPGMATLEEVNADIINDFSQLTEEQHNECEKICSGIGEEFCRRCGYCGPCPQGIDIAGAFTLKNYSVKYNLHNWAKGRYNAAAKNADDCIECGKCEPKCPYNLPIREMLKETKKVFAR